MLERVSNGATADLMNQISYSRLGGAGAYSAYIGAIIDFGRIMGSLHTAQYQYIPALAVPRGESLSLRLNNPPSFRKPQSVMVVALPPVRPVPPPKLQAVEGNEGHCLSDPSLVLPTDGPPLLFATQYAHDTFLRVQDVSGHTVELPVHTDPSRAGFVVRNEHNSWDSFSAELTGTIHGMWGFDSFQGPQFKLHLARPEEWSVVPNDKTALIVGREDLLHVEGQDTACVRAIDLLDSTGTNKALRWKALGPRSLEIKLPLEHRKPGAVEIAIRQHELAEPDKVIAQSYEEAAQFDGFEISSGDTRGTLRGKRLDEVRQLRLGDVEFRADQLSRRANHDELILKATAATDTLQTDQTSASVVLIDGRVFQIPASVMPPRPVITLISKGVQGDDAARTNTIHLSSTDEFPSDGRIVFSVKSVAPAVFPRGAKIEVAATDNSFHTVLTMSEGTLVLQDSRTALGVLDPEKTFGKSAFGAIQFRAVTPQGTAGNWQPLGTLVRLPELKQITCPKTRIAPCVLNGTNLFLLRTVSTDGTAEQEVTVPDGFTGQELTIGRPVANTLHLSLRDDPEIKQTVTLPIVEEGGSRIQ
jgi:hypothetical protein